MSINILDYLPLNTSIIYSKKYQIPKYTLVQEIMIHILKIHIIINLIGMKM